MRVGLYDCDIDSRAYNNISIDLLKLSADYFIKKDIYSLMSSLDRLDYYSKIHYWSDLKPHYLPKTLLRDNIEPGGLVFGIKIPREIEDLNYDTEIYRKWYEKYGNIKQKQDGERISVALRSSHIRLMRDNELLNYAKHINPSRKTIIIHDENLFQVPNWQDIFKDMESLKKMNSFGFRYPLIINSLEEDKAIHNFNLSFYYTKLRFNLNANIDDLIFFAEKYRKLWFRQEFFIIPNKRFSTNNEKKMFLRKILLRLIFCQSLVDAFYLTYDKIFYYNNDDDFNSFIDLLVLWSIKKREYRNKIASMSLMEFLTMVPDKNKITALEHFKEDKVLKEIALLKPKQINRKIVEDYESIRD